MQNSKHDHALAVETVLNDASSIQYTNYNLPIFNAPLNRAAEVGVIGKNLNLVDQLVGNEPR